jgi:hypothetical protein
VGKIALQSSPRKRGPMITGRWLWVPALAALGRDDSWMARRISLRLYGMGAGASSLFRACSLQGMVQLPRVCRIEPANSLHGDVVEWPHAAAPVVV